MYNVFESGTIHGIYAKFIAQAADFHNEKLVYYIMQEPDLQPGTMQFTEPA